MKVVLVHGWGYDASLWDAVRAHLAPDLAVETVDLGYFDVKETERSEHTGTPREGGEGGRARSGAVSPAPTFAEPVLAVGHSLGVLWWLAQPTLPWQRLVSINGFPRFTATDGYPGVAPRVLERMRKQFDASPAAVLADFHRRCGAPGPTRAPDHAALAAGLAQLATLDGRDALAARHEDVFALVGSDDPIVPRALSDAAFAALPPGQVELVAAPGHLLPLTHPGLCAQWIARLAT